MKRQLAKQKAKTFNILGEEYTKASISKKIKEIKQTHPVGIIVDGNDGEFLKEIFKMHPRYNEKTQGNPVVSISHEKAQGNTTCFYFCTENNIKEDFSIANCTKNITQYYKERITSAYRNEIRDQITRYKEERGYGITQCDLCAKIVGNYNWTTGATHVCNNQIAGHIDHDKNHATFAQIFQDFLFKYGSDASNPALTRRKTEFNTFEWVLDNIKLKHDWSMFHQEQAKFRLLCVTCNCSVEKTTK